MIGRNKRSREEAEAPPTFPPEGCEEGAAYFVHVSFEDGETCYPVPPPGLRFLTVYRFDYEGEDYEATATREAFNSERGLVTDIKPRGERWSWGGRMSDRSSLWLRPYSAERYGSGGGHD